MASGASNPSGRQAQAAENDRRILEAARAVFLADPDAPIATVAHRAGVGMAALYRRYEGKEALLQHLALDGLRRYNTEVEGALANTGDAWNRFADFMARSLAVGGGSLSRRLRGTFTITDDLRQEGIRAVALTERLIQQTKDASALRPEIQATDISLLSETLQAISIGDEQRDAELRHRYLRVVLDGLRAGAGDALPGSPPDLTEMARRYNA